MRVEGLCDRPLLASLGTKLQEAHVGRAAFDLLVAATSCLTISKANYSNHQLQSAGNSRPVLGNAYVETPKQIELGTAGQLNNAFFPSRSFSALDRLDSSNFLLRKEASHADQLVIGKSYLLDGEISK